MRIRWLGWAGVEIESDGATVGIDPLRDASATVAPLGGSASEGELPRVVAPDGARRAVAGLVTHLHRDHTDAEALSFALAPDAAVHEPRPSGGSDVENAALAQADADLRRTGLQRRAV